MGKIDPFEDWEDELVTLRRHVFILGFEAVVLVVIAWSIFGCAIDLTTQRRPPAASASCTCQPTSPKEAP